MTNSELKRDLSSPSIAIISKALDYISEYGSHDIIPELIALLQKNKNDDIQYQIISIFENLRDQQSLPHIIDALMNIEYRNIRGLLVATCWKNSLNFEEFPELFTDIFIDSDFTEAFDALTVIENMHSIIEEKANRCILKLENHLEEAKDLKKSIICELIKIVQSHTENPAE
ncbi:MAG: hypothetical protein A2W99_09890 [Bacteroidetes bacterium GWF2_33_16]|nr:MAG: hypothetical protein A2W99_09890 [Bacteroidetes bacterium GWF2_33_16]